MLKFILFDLTQNVRKNNGALPSQPSVQSAAADPSQITKGNQPVGIQNPPLHISSETGQKAGMVCGPTSLTKGFIFHLNAPFESRFQLRRMQPKHPTAICKSPIFLPKNTALNAIIKFIQSLHMNNSKAQWLSEVEVPAYILMRYPSWKKFYH